MMLEAMVMVLSQAPAQAERLSGTVVEKLDAAGYSYLRISTGPAEEWAAVPQVDFDKGTVVTIEVQARMQGFASKSLKRSWPVIAFGTVIAPAPAAAPQKPVENPHAKGLPRTLDAPPVEGTVLERLDAGTYSYLRLKTKAGELWAAVPRAEVPNGMTVTIRNAQPMDGFQSPSLKRTFERIVFGTLELPPARKE